MTNLVLKAKKEAQAEQLLHFLSEVYNLCNNNYADISLDSIVKKYKIPTTFYAISKEYALLDFKREGMFNLYKWNSIDPTIELAKEMNEKIRAKQKEYSDKAYQLKKQNNPSKLVIGSKTFSKVIKGPSLSESIIKPVPSTPSEIALEKSLNEIKGQLNQVNVLNLDDLCFRIKISEPTQFALIKLKCIVKVENSGYKWIKGDVTLDLIQEIFKIRGEYNGYMPPVFVDKQLGDPISNNPKKLSKAFKYYEFLLSLYKLTNQKETQISLAKVMKDNKIYSTFFMYLKEHPLLIKNGIGRDTSYTWNQNYAVTMELSNTVYDWCKDKFSLYAGTNKSKKEKKNSIEPKVEATKEVIKETVNDTSNHKVSQHVTAQEEPKQEFDNRAILAEKFAKVGNFKMAEELLDQILNSK